MVPASGPRLKNRVDPFGAFHATVARGSLMGNQGGRLHRDDRTLGRRRWTSKRWVPCRCKFKSRRREVWSGGYTELFFSMSRWRLPPVRPCFECRRGQRRAFLAAFPGAPRNADAMDEVLHAERLIGCGKRHWRSQLGGLPDGAMIATEGGAGMRCATATFCRGASPAMKALSRATQASKSPFCRCPPWLP